MTVIKKINNNVAICKDNSGRELVAFGKGIGFLVMPYELTDLRKIERTFYNISMQYIPLLKEIPYEIIQFTADERQVIQDELPCETYSNLVLTLADHIAFVIERTQKGIYVKMPSIYEIEFSYPQEVKAGRYLVAAIKRKCKIKLPKSEVQGIAMHLINARERFKIEETQEKEQMNEEILEETTHIIEKELSVKVQRETFNYVRFATHVQYLVQRISEQKPIDTENVLLYKSVQEDYTKVSDCVDSMTFLTRRGKSACKKGLFCSYKAGLKTEPVVMLYSLKSNFQMSAASEKTFHQDNLQIK